jgi:hypothetical protein
MRLRLFFNELAAFVTASVFAIKGVSFDAGDRQGLNGRQRVARGSVVAYHGRAR